MAKALVLDASPYSSFACAIRAPFCDVLGLGLDSTHLFWEAVSRQRGVFYKEERVAGVF